MTSTRGEAIIQQIDALQREENELFDELLAIREAEWQARIDELKVQWHLGTVELRERVGPALEALHDRVAQLRTEVAAVGDTTMPAVLEALRTGFVAAFDDIAEAVRQARATVRDAV